MVLVNSLIVHLLVEGFLLIFQFLNLVFLTANEEVLCLKVV